jgi:hypothetical protein
MKIFFRFALRLVVGAIIGATIGAAIGACCILGWANLQAPASKLSYSSFEKWAGQNLRTSILSDLPNGAITGIMIGSLSSSRPEVDRTKGTAKYPSAVNNLASSILGSDSYASAELVSMRILTTSVATISSRRPSP